jgi:hypothetical protein
MGLLKVRGRKIQREHGGMQVESAGRERACFSFSGVFKTYTTPWEDRPRRFPPSNERVGRGMGGSQPGEGGLGHPQATCMSSTFPASSLPHFTY